MWVVQAVTHRARAGNPEQTAKKDLMFPPPITNLLHDFIHGPFWSLPTSCFSFVGPINNVSAQPDLEEQRIVWTQLYAYLNGSLATIWLRMELSLA